MSAPAPFTFLDVPGHPGRRIGGVVIAAESWQRDGDDLEGLLRVQVAQQRRAFLQRDAEQHRAAVEPMTRARVVSSFADRRRHQLDAVAPRDGDHHGGPAPWLPKPRNHWDERLAAAEPELMCDAGCGASMAVDPDGCGDGCRAGNRRQVTT